MFWFFVSNIYGINKVVTNKSKCKYIYGYFKLSRFNYVIIWFYLEMYFLKIIKLAKIT